MIKKNKTGPKKRERPNGAKLMMLPLECNNDEMENLLKALNSKIGTNNNRMRYEWLYDMIGGKHES